MRGRIGLGCDGVEGMGWDGCGLGWDAIGWDEMGWDGIVLGEVEGVVGVGWGGVGWDAMRCDVMGCNYDRGLTTAVSLGSPLRPQCENIFIASARWHLALCGPALRGSTTTRQTSAIKVTRAIQQMRPGCCRRDSASSSSSHSVLALCRLYCTRSKAAMEAQFAHTRSGD